MTTILGRNTPGNIYRAQAPAIATLTGIHATTTVITKQLQGSAKCHSALCLRLRPCLEAPNTPQSTHSPRQGTLVSSVVMSYASYYLSLGKLSLSYGQETRKPDEHGTEEFSFSGRWDFDPESWVSYRSIGIQARLLVRVGELSKPRITPGLAARVCVSKGRPVWEHIRSGDLMGVRRYLSTGSIGINDTTLSGRTLLIEVYNWLLYQATATDILLDEEL